MLAISNRKLIPFIAILSCGCHHIVRGNPLTLPTLEHGRGAIVHLVDEREAQYYGDVTISQKGWVLVISPWWKLYETPPNFDVKDLTDPKAKISVKMHEYDGLVFAGKPGHRIHYAVQGILAQPPPKPAERGEID